MPLRTSPRPSGSTPSTPAFNNRGLAHLQAKAYDQAIRDFDESLRIDPKDVQALCARGSAWEAKGELDKAIDDYGRAIELDPKNPTIIRDRGMAWEAKQEYEKAIDDFTRVLELDPKDSFTLLHRGKTWQDKKEYEKAIADFTRAIELAPAYALAFHARGDVWVLKGLPDKAVKDYEEALRLKPLDHRMMIKLAWLLATDPDTKVRDGKRAVGLATRGCDLTGWKQPIYFHTLATAYAEVGEFDRAVEYQKKALADEDTAKTLGADGPRQLKLFEQKKPYREGRIR